MVLRICSLFVRKQHALLSSCVQIAGSSCKERLLRHCQGLLAHGWQPRIDGGLCTQEITVHHEVRRSLEMEARESGETNGRRAALAAG